MKRLNTSLVIHLPPVSLFREDIVKIAETLTQNDGKLRLKTEKFEYDSLEELFSNQEDTLFKLSLARDEPHISVEFDGSIGVLIYSSRDDLLSKAIFFELQSLLEAKRRWSHLAVAKITKISGWLGALGGGAFATVGNWTAATLFWMLIPLDIIFSFAKHRSAISREPLAQRKGFWRRNSDQIVVALIATIAGAVITLIITPLLPGTKP
jgi:hypothetical protein